MISILTFEFHQSLIYKKCRWTPWMLLCFMLSGTHSLITVLQSPVLAVSLGHDAIMQCQLAVSHDEKLKNTQVLYWEYLTPDKNEKDKVFPPSNRFKGRVDRLDSDLTSPNKSICFKNVQWGDSGTYRCKLSVTSERAGSERKLGNGTVLRVYDTMSFNITSHNDSLLQCAVNVSWDPGFVLIILHGGFKLQIQKMRNRTTDLPYISLSDTITLNGTGEYECQLHLNADLITKKIFLHNLTEPDDVVYPEPWLLYVALILVPITFLLVLITAMLVYRC